MIEADWHFASYIITDDWQAGHKVCRYCVLVLLRKAWDSTGTSVKKKLTTAM